MPQRPEGNYSLGLYQHGLILPAFEFYINEITLFKYCFVSPIFCSAFQLCASCTLLHVAVDLSFSLLRSFLGVKMLQLIYPQEILFIYRRKSALWWTYIHVWLEWNFWAVGYAK